MRVEFGHAVVFGTFGEALSMRRGKSGWGQLVKIEPLRPDDVLHPTRIVYQLKATNRMRQRWEFRDTFRNVLGKDRRLVTLAMQLKKSEFLERLTSEDTRIITSAFRAFFCSPMSSQLYAVQHIRRMRGGSQAQFLRASDGNFYVTKFQNNPQHPRVLANEMLASRLGKWLGLPVPEVVVIEVSEWLIQNTTELRIESVGHSVPCQSGLHLGSRYPVDPWEGVVFDCLPESYFSKVRNADDFFRMLVLDKWAGNADGRQAIFFKSGRQRKYTVQFIDQGYCFNAGEWTFADLALHGVYYRNYVYAGVTGWESFEPALTKAEEADVVLDLWRCAECIPPEWYGYDREGLEKLVESMYERRSKIRDLITAFRDSNRNPFPNWKPPSSCAVPQSTFAYEFQPL